MITLEVTATLHPPGAEDATFFASRCMEVPRDGWWDEPHLWMRYVSLFAGTAPVGSLPKDLREAVDYGLWDWR